MQAIITQAISDIKNAVISEEAAAKSLFEQLATQADAEIAPLIATGNKNYGQMLNSLLSELRGLIKEKFPEISKNKVVVIPEVVNIDKGAPTTK